MTDELSDTIEIDFATPEYDDIRQGDETHEPLDDVGTRSELHRLLLRFDELPVDFQIPGPTPGEDYPTVAQIEAALVSATEA